MSPRYPYFKNRDGVASGEQSTDWSKALQEFAAMVISSAALAIAINAWMKAGL